MQAKVIRLRAGGISVRHVHVVMYNCTCWSLRVMVTHSTSVGHNRIMANLRTPNKKRRSPNDGDEDAHLHQALKSYKYVAPNLSCTERWWLNDFWTWVAYNVWPSWLAPNMITLSGFGFMLVCFLTMLTYSPELDGSTPDWWLLLAPFCVFTYQTCDGSDGKQARRTKSGSPLGEMFDHGVDALVLTCIFTIGMEMSKFSMRAALMPLGYLAGQAAFFTSNLVLLHTGKQHFNEIDCQEFQVFIQGLCVLFFIVDGKHWLCGELS